MDQADPGFCHLPGRRTCFGDDGAFTRLARHLAHRVTEAPEGSYTRRLLDDPALLRGKLLEEAGELAQASSPEHVAAEAADLLYFAFVALARTGVDLARVARELEARALGQPPPRPCQAAVRVGGSHDIHVDVKGG